MARTNTSSGGGGGGVTDLNGLTGAVTLSAGNNVTLNESGNDIEITANFTQEGKYMISGGITWSGTGLTYDVSFLNYFFNGNKTANPTQVTLTASDPTDNRFDAIVVDEAGTVTAITGTPSANPEVPAIPEDQLQVTIILVAAGSTTPTIATEEIYMDDPTTNWTFSTYQTATPTGSINFAGTSSPKQGTECIEASTDARLGARFVRSTSFDAFQYTMLQVWVRFTGTAVATNKSLNVRFENSAGTLVGSTVNLFSYGLQRGVLNTWQLVVVPITAFGALPATVKGLKMIMAGGTVGVVRQWDIDYMILTNGSVPFANVPTIAFYKDDVGIASQSGINLIEGLGGATIDAVNNPLYNRVDYTVNAFGGDALSYRDETTQESVISREYDNVSPTYTLTIANVFGGVPSGTFTVGETMTGGTSGAIGIYEYFDGTSINIMYITVTSGVFEVGETITGGTSGQTFVPYDVLANGWTIGDTFSVKSSATGNGNGSGEITAVGSGTVDITLTSGTLAVDDYIEDATFTNATGILAAVAGTPITTAIETGLNISDTIFGGISGSVLQHAFGTDKISISVAGDLRGLDGKASEASLISFDNTTFALTYASSNSDGFQATQTKYADAEQGRVIVQGDRVSLTTADTTTTSTPITHGITSTIAGTTTIGNIVNGNNTKITIDDATQTVSIGDTLNTGILVDKTNDVIEFTSNSDTTYSSDIPKSIKVTVPSSDMLSVVTGPTPYELIPAPGLGNIIQVLSIRYKVNFNTTVYDFNATLRIGTNTTGSTTTGTDGGQVIAANINTSVADIFVSASAGGNTQENVALYLNAGTATTVTQGDSDVDFYITYKIVTL